MDLDALVKKLDDKLEEIKEAEKSEPAKTTSTRKIYCSPDCCNRVTQDRYRKNNRAKKE